MKGYKINEAAAEDIEQLFDYGIDNFGVTSARSYVEGMTQRFADIAKHPLQYQAVEHIREGYRRSVYGRHSIYYRLNGDHVDIMRILRSQNINDAF